MLKIGSRYTKIAKPTKKQVAGGTATVGGGAAVGAAGGVVHKALKTKKAVEHGLPSDKLKVVADVAKAGAANKGKGFRKGVGTFVRRFTKDLINSGKLSKPTARAAANRGLEAGATEFVKHSAGPFFRKSAIKGAKVGAGVAAASVGTYALNKKRKTKKKV